MAISDFTTNVGGVIRIVNQPYNYVINLPEPRTSAEFNGSIPTMSSSSGSITADGATVPIIYGRQAVQGAVITAPTTYGGDLYVSVGWCIGEIGAVGSVFINNAAVPAGVEVRHYRGTTDQGVDSWLSTAISGYRDTCVTSYRGQDIALAYSVFKIPVSALSGVPRFSAIIHGKLVYDPTATSGTDPYADSTVLDVDFTDGGTDQSSEAHTITLFGDASITSGGLQLDGTGDYASVADDASLEMGSEECSLEIVATSDTVEAGTSTLLSHGAAADLSVRIQRDAATIKLYISSDGSTYDIANGTSAGTITTAEFKWTLERVGNELIAYLDGEEEARISSSASLFDSAATWELGSYSAGDEWSGSVQAVRILKGSYRYGAEHTAGAATASPFADSDTYTSGTVYSTNFALFAGDIASSTVYGLGATVDGLSDAKAWCLENLVGGDVVPQGTGGLTIPSSRRASYWMTVACDYANSIWFPYGAGIRIQPDDVVSATNPSGQEICEHGEFDAATGWTEGDGWNIGSGVATIDGTQVAASTLSRALTTEHGVDYGVIITISAITAGSITVMISGSDVIVAQTTAGTYAEDVLIFGTSKTLQIYASSDAVATVSIVSVRRLSWLQDNWIKDSLTISGPSDRGSPNGVKVKYRVPDNDSPNWATRSGTAAIPDAKNGLISLVETTLDYPGLPTEDQARNKALRKTNRMNNRLKISYLAVDDGVLHQKGAAIQLERALRGVDVTLWVEDVEMVDYGRYRVSGVKYDAEDFTKRLVIDAYDSEAYSELMINYIAPSYYWKMIQGGDTPTASINNELLEEINDWHLTVGGTYADHDPEHDGSEFPGFEHNIATAPGYSWGADSAATLTRVESAPDGLLLNQPGLSFGCMIDNRNGSSGEFNFTIRGKFSGATEADYSASITVSGDNLVVQVPGQGSAYTIVDAIEGDGLGGGAYYNVVVVVDGISPYGANSGDTSDGMTGKVYVNNVLVYTTAAQINAEWLYIKSVEVIPTKYAQVQHAFIGGGMMSSDQRDELLAAHISILTPEVD